MKGLGFRLKTLLFIWRPSPWAAVSTMAVEGYSDFEIDLEEAAIRRVHMREIVAHLLTAPDSQLDASMVEKIRTWDDPPKAIQVLEVLDHCVHGALASGLVMQVLEMLYAHSLENEGKDHAEVVALATWRDAQRA